MEEYIDLYDKNKENTGIVIPRSKEGEIEEGHYVLISALLIQNDKSEIMMQLTSKQKGHVLALPGGHVIHNENSLDTIVREMFEEQGIIINKNDVQLIEERFANNMILLNLYYLKGNYDRKNMILQEEEVEDVVWMLPQDILKEYEKGRVRKSSADSVKNFLSSKYYLKNK